ncbi:pyrimidine-nucleoside phosphorylase [Desulfohalotomaculum tongense]|uniref:pyrimidine-nucleoside phosphorylase n=1 Tax=Desulforadius tongensis TaxID=1216062 RepID=UPI00195E4218|nr:pyrimidine-nucleoside phosphorylase [Desulforadius tongensis]MBM7854697.1 pyrimidine-nucleoside phosphorylase [Desulforadius tongensis]
MRMYDLIMKKRQGEELSAEEIDFIVQGYTRGIIPDYQIAAWLMAVYFQKLSARETVDLTMSMVNSGEKLDLSKVPGPKVDKHSTGGVGDKTTLVLAPMVAAAGVPVAKMSGRGLGHTGGTIDKLESIRGFNVSLTQQQFFQQLEKVKVAVVAQTGELAPADKKFYALRDVTATVDDISLISSSIMSKKIAAGAESIVLDVKVGSGAFMRNIDDAFKLARTMVEIGNSVGRNTVALVTDMDQPLGFAVGNAVEVAEAIDTLKGRGPRDLYTLCLELGAQMIAMAGVVPNVEEGKKHLQQLVDSGAALEKMREFITAQNGDAGVVDDPGKLPQAKYQEQVLAGDDGYVQAIAADEVGKVAMQLGAGRAAKEDKIDHAAGLILHKKIGDKVQTGEPLATLYTNDSSRMPQAKEMLLKTYTIGARQPEPRNIIHGLVTGQ